MTNAERKGQWLYNKIRFADPKKLMNDYGVGHHLWNMSNDEFDKIMEKY